MTPRPLRVLHVFGPLDRGGAELRTIELLEPMQQRGVAFDFCALSARKGSMAAAVEAEGATVTCLPMGWRFPFRLFSLLRSGRLDAVHAHVDATGLVLAVAKLAGVPRRIAHFRSTDTGRRRSLGQRAKSALLRRLVDWAATDIVGVAQAVLTSAWGGWERDPRCRAIYVGLPPHTPTPVDRESAGIPSEGPLIVHVGRIVAAKNHLRLLRIFREILRLSPEAHLVLVGDAQDPALAAKVHEAIDGPLAGSVTALGERRDARDWLAAADLLLLPSTREGLPGVAVEAWAAGTPVLASTLPGVVELAALSPSITCLDLEASDATWAAQALSLIEAGAPGREAAKRGFGESPFRVEASADAHLRLYGKT